MAYAPCKNPNCNSFGKPHPNCKCYGGMAYGGEVGFCNEARSHDQSCQYFASGGQAQEIDHSHQANGFMARHGLIGLLRMHRNNDVEKHQRHSQGGHKNIDSMIESVLENKRVSKEDRSKHQKFIQEWIDRGGIDHDIHQEMNGQKPVILHNHQLATEAPAQNVLLQAAKARTSNYLSSLKPQEMAPKLTFDEMPSQDEKKKIYEEAVKIADHPMSIFHDLSTGKLGPSQLKHLAAIYPEVYNSVKQKVVEKITELQLKGGKKPNHMIRQGLSLLMGVPLSGELTPAGIVSAQSVFANKKSEQPPPGIAPTQKGAKKSLTKSDQSFLTGGQSLVKRQQKT